MGEEIASIGMFEIKPRERQLHGGAPQPACVTLWGVRACHCLPSVPASAGQTPQEGFARRVQQITCGIQGLHVPMPFWTIPSSTCVPTAEQQLIHLLSAPGLLQVRQQEGIGHLRGSWHRGSAYVCCCRELCTVIKAEGQ